MRRFYSSSKEILGRIKSIEDLNGTKTFIDSESILDNWKKIPEPSHRPFYHTERPPAKQYQIPARHLVSLPQPSVN